MPDGKIATVTDLSQGETMAHIADAMVVVCMDFRLQKHVRTFIDTELPGKTYDLVSFAGSTKNLDTIMTQIDTSVRLHQIKQLVLVHHEDCGAYGAESTYERHAHDLNLAKKTVLAKYPEVSVDMFYMYLDGRYERVGDQ